MEIKNNNKLEFQLLSKTDEERIKKEIENKKKDFQNKKDKYSLFFNNETGIEFLKELATKSGFFQKRALFYNSQNSVDTSKICFADGYREMFLEVLTLLNEDIINKILSK